MIHPRRLFIATCFASLMPLGVFAEAPVVDDSENFALLDEQQAADERPVSKRQASTSYTDEETALANDNTEASYNGNTHAASGANVQNNAVLLDKVQGLQQEVQELRGQLEVQSHDLKILQQQQVDFYKDLDARIRHEPVKAANSGPLPETSIAPKEPLPNKAEPFNKQAIQPVVNNPNNANPADEQISYLAAYELVKNKKFDEALVAMQTFVAQHPQGGYTANAQYWLGELYMVKKSYPEAIEHFEIVMQQFPASSKSAASLLKIGYALAAMGKKEEAIARLQQVIKNYPDTNTAQLAKAKLESITN